MRLNVDESVVDNFKMVRYIEHTYNKFAIIN